MTKQQKIEDLKRQAAQIAEEIAGLEAEPDSGPKEGELVAILYPDVMIEPSEFDPSSVFHRDCLAAGNLFWGPNAERNAEYVADRRKNHEAKCPPPFEGEQNVWYVSGYLRNVYQAGWSASDLTDQAMHHARLVFATKEEAEARRMELKEGK